VVSEPLLGYLTVIDLSTIKGAARQQGVKKMSEDKSLTKIHHFDGQHYDHWSELMENLLRAKGDYGVLWKSVFRSRLLGVH
jgi:hypothetical protein